MAVLVAFEGIDGSGKTTVARRVADQLEDAGRPIHLTREPTDTALGRRTRSAIADPVHPVAQALLFMADHRQHVDDVQAKLDEDVHVLSDRWNDSCFAYQAATLADHVDEPMAWLKQGMGEDRRPDRVVYLDVDVDTVLGRIGDREAEASFERRELLERVRDNYEELADRFGDYAVVDATRDVEKVVDDALSAVETCIKASSEPSSF